MSHVKVACDEIQIIVPMVAIPATYQQTTVWWYQLDPVNIGSTNRCRMHQIYKHLSLAPGLYLATNNSRNYYGGQYTVAHVPNTHDPSIINFFTTFTI